MTRKYDAKDVQLSVAGRQITGFGPDTAVTVDKSAGPDSPAFFQYDRETGRPKLIVHPAPQQTLDAMFQVLDELKRSSFSIDPPQFFSRQMEPIRDVEFNCDVCGCLIETWVLATATHASGICRPCFEEWERVSPFGLGFHGYHSGGWQSGPCQCTPCEEKRALESLWKDLGGEGG